MAGTLPYRVLRPNRKSKFNAKMREYNGVMYHSIREAKYAEQLDWQVKGGAIKNWERQVKLDLKVNGVLICRYVVDFKVINKMGGVELHEVKGFETADWKLKWKLLEALRDEVCPGATLLVIK
jgi:hypothetical protein